MRAEMIRTFKYLLALAATTILCGLLTPAAAQVISELRAFTAAVEEFEDGNYALAEKELAEFIRLFPQSAHSSEAVLYQGQAALKQKKYSAAVGLLSTNAAS